MQSADYVPGVSGWKMDKALFELNGGPFGPIRIGDLSAPEASVSDEQLAVPCLTRQDRAQPFIVVDGITYINQALIDDGATSDWITVALADFESSAQFLVEPHRFAVRLARNSNGKYYCAGVGLGVEREKKTASADEICGR